MSDLDKAIRDALADRDRDAEGCADSYQMAVYAEAIRSVLDWARRLEEDNDGASAHIGQMFAQQIRLRIARELGVSSQDTAPAPRAAWTTPNGWTWRQVTDAPDLLWTPMNGGCFTRPQVEATFGRLSPATQTGGDR